MPYVTSVERIGYERGHLEGHAEGRRAEAASLVQRLLRRRFGALSAAIEERITALSLERSEELGEALLDFTALADLETWLSRN
jgi:predicted transposase YdaD